MSEISHAIAVADAITAAINARKAANEAMIKACDDLNAALIAARSAGVNFRSGGTPYLIVTPTLVESNVSSVMMPRSDFNNLSEAEQAAIVRSRIGVY